MPTEMVPRYIPDDPELRPQALFFNGIASGQVIWNAITHPRSVAS